MNRKDNDQEDANVDLFDRQQVRNYIGFVTGSVRRRKWLVAGVLTSIVALAIGALWALPKTYHVEAKLLAQRSQVLAVRGDGPDSTAPTHGAAETVQRRDNLVAIIQATGLVRHWAEHQAPAQRLMGWISGLTHAADTEQDQIDGLVETLEKKLQVWTTDGTVTIAIDWSDAQMASRLVDAAQQNFLETRYAQEITALAESITIVRSHAASQTADIDEAVIALEKLRSDRRDPKGGAATPSPTMPTAGAAQPTYAPRAAVRRLAEPKPELAQLKIAIETKQRVIDDLEDARRHRIAEVQARLTEAKATYTESHPAVIDLQQTLAATSVQSPQVKTLRQEVSSLKADYEGKAADARGEPAPVAAGGGPAPSRNMDLASAAMPPQLPGEILRLDEELREDRDPATVYARGQLRDAMDKYAALRTLVQTAQIDLETAQAAFKYRYSVLTPAQVPKKPTKPNAPIVVFGAFIAGIFVSIFVAVMADIRTGRLVERWQIERLLDRPILGEIELPQLPEHDAE